MALGADHRGHPVHAPTDERSSPRGDGGLTCHLLRGAFGMVECRRLEAEDPLLPPPFQLRQLPGLDLAVRCQEVRDASSERPLPRMVVPRSALTAAPAEPKKDNAISELDSDVF